MKNCYYEKLSNLTTCHFTLLNSVMVAIYKRDKLHSHDYHVKATYFNFWPCTRVGNIIGPQFVSIARFVSVAKTIEFYIKQAKQTKSNNGELKLTKNNDLR